MNSNELETFFPKSQYPLEALVTETLIIKSDFTFEQQFTIGKTTKTITGTWETWSYSNPNVFKFYKLMAPFFSKGSVMPPGGSCMGSDDLSDLPRYAYPASGYVVLYPVYSQTLNVYVLAHGRLDFDECSYGTFMRI
jgi:hypothetical protein